MRNQKQRLQEEFGQIKKEREDLAVRQEEAKRKEQEQQVKIRQ